MILNTSYAYRILTARNDFVNELLAKASTSWADYFAVYFFCCMLISY